MTAARLEEEQGNGERAHAIIKRGIKSLQSKNVVMKREDWLERAKYVTFFNNIFMVRHT